MKGLEATEIQLSEVVEAASTFRFDPQYFSKNYIAQAELARQRHGEFKSFEDLGIAIDSSAFYPSIEPFYGSGTLPFLRVADVDSVIDFENCTTIPHELCQRFPTLKKIESGDIVLTKGGSVARIGIVKQEAAASRDLIFVNSSKLEEHDSTFLALYFQTQFANDLLTRSSSQTAQPHLTLTLVRDIPLFWPSENLRKKVLEVVQTSYTEREKSLSFYNQAETLLLEALNLQNWQPPQPLTYASTCSAAFAAGRLDAEHFQPQYAAAREALRQNGARDFITLDELLADLTNGHTPLYHDLKVGDVPFLAAEHVNDFTINYDSEKRILAQHHRLELARTALQNGDVLMTIKGRVGNAALVENLPGPVNINQDVARLQFNQRLPIWFTLAFLNSRFGKLAVEEQATGQINPFLGLGNLRQIPIPVFDTAFMDEIATKIEDLTHQAQQRRQNAKALLEAAKRAVEIAIESDEDAALAELKNVH